MAQILQARDREELVRRFDGELKQDVNLKLFTRPETGLYIPGRQCPTCRPTERLLREMCELSPKLRLQVTDFYKEAEEAARLGIHQIPALFIDGATEGRVRFYGMPSGYEFPVLLDAILMASTGDCGLKPRTRQQLGRLTEDVHIQVFVTPTWPYCPVVARAAHAMALESPRVRADVIEIQEFPHLARLYGVRSVPKTVINDGVEFTGAVQEEAFVDGLLSALGLEQAGSAAEKPVGGSTPLT